MDTTKNTTSDRNDLGHIEFKPNTIDVCPMAEPNLRESLLHKQFMVVTLADGTSMFVKLQGDIMGICLHSHNSNIKEGWWYRFDGPTFRLMNQSYAKKQRDISIGNITLFEGRELKTAAVFDTDTVSTKEEILARLRELAPAVQSLT